MGSPQSWLALPVRLSRGLGIKPGRGFSYKVQQALCDLAEDSGRVRLEPSGFLLLKVLEAREGPWPVCRNRRQTLDQQFPLFPPTVQHPTHTRPCSEG